MLNVMQTSVGTLKMIIGRSSTYLLENDIGLLEVAEEVGLSTHQPVSKAKEKCTEKDISPVIIKYMVKLP